MSNRTTLILLIAGGFVCVALALVATIAGLPLSAGPLVALAVLLFGLAWFGPWRGP